MGNLFKNKNTEPLYESFYATQQHPEHDNNYWYNIENFDKLLKVLKNMVIKMNFVII